jgi:hypothetical protein
MMIAFLISLVTAHVLPATPAATTCGHWLDAATARDRVGWVEIDCEDLPCPCSTESGGGEGNDGREPGAGGSCTKPEGVQRLVFRDSEYPNIVRHFRGALRRGWPRRLVLNRRDADARRDRLLEHYATRDGYDRDEYPPADTSGDARRRDQEKRSAPAAPPAPERTACTRGTAPASGRSRRSWPNPPRVREGAVRRRTT